MFEETAATLFCGDLLTHGGDGPALTEVDITASAIAMEDVFHSMSMSPNTDDVLRRLAALAPVTLALMHGSSYRGDCEAALTRFADHYSSAAG